MKDALAMADRKNKENFYDLLKVDARATTAEIVSAYHAAKNAFSKDSVATYSLFSSEEAVGVLAQLEEAYLTLSNLERRAEYDRQLKNPDGIMTGPLTASMAESLPSELGQTLTAPATTATATGDATVVSIDVGSATPATENKPDECSGSRLREMRALRGLSIEDVSRITKIPSKFLRSIEDDEFKRLPARVYIQGFVKNLAVLYKVDPKGTAKSYLAYLDRVAPGV